LGATTPIPVTTTRPMLLSHPRSLRYLECSVGFPILDSVFPFFLALHWARSFRLHDNGYPEIARLESKASRT
jgi:hypothetical protein